MALMAWRKNLLDCSFRDVVFDVIGTRDSYGRAISVAEVPYVDGGVVEDLGARPVRYSLQLIFFGDDYEDQLAKAKKVFDQVGAGRLVHPVMGVIEKAQVVSYEVGHEAPAPDACTLTVEFIESGKPKVFFSKANPAVTLQTKVGSLADSALGQAKSALANAMAMLKSLNPLAAFDNLRATMLGPVLAFAGQVQGIVTSGLDVLNSPRAWAADIAGLAGSVLSIASFGDRLKQDWSAVTGVFSNIAAKFGFGSIGRQSGGQPSAASGTGQGGYAAFVAAQTATGPVQSDVDKQAFYAAVSAAPVWVEGTAPTEAQVAARAQTYLSVVNATSVAETAALVLATEQATPTFSPAEIEAVVSLVRIEINAAIEAAHATLPLEQAHALAETLKDIALTMQLAGQSIIELQPPLLTRTLDAPGNLRLIAHRWYGDHSRAPELARLNALRSPNALQMGDTLRAYAE